MMCKYNSLFKITLAAALLGMNSAYATEEISITLEKLDVVHQQEKCCDELYFSVTEVPRDAKCEKCKFRLPKHYQVPNYPSHWLSKYSNKINNITLWKKTVNGCESTDVVFSLVEEDLPPWNLDDLLGSIELKIRCENGKLATHWEIPNGKITAQIADNPNGFSFTGKKAEYHGLFKIQHIMNPVKSQSPQFNETPLEQPLPLFP